MARERWSGRLAVFAAFALLLVGATTVRAQESESRARSPWDRDWLFEASVGFGTPVGLFGAHLERRLTPFLAVRAGLGSNLRGLQGAAMARLRLPTAPALNLGAGLSGGSFTPFCPFCEVEPHPSWDLALWNNYELSLEARAQGGFMFRVFGGAAWLLNPNAKDCPDCDGDDSMVPTVLGFFGLAAGAAFE